LNAPGDPPPVGVGGAVVGVLVRVGVDVVVRTGGGRVAVEVLVSVAVAVLVGVWVAVVPGLVVVAVLVRVGVGLGRTGVLVGRKFHQVPLSANVAPELFTAWTCQ